MSAQDWHDPRFWPTNSEHEFRIYGDDRCTIWAVVDEVDYQHLVKHRWNPKLTKGKLYLRRAISTYHEKGGRKGSATVYLHVEVMRRADKKAPSSRHSIVDHKDGNSLNCRRSNLRWATKTQNNQNRFGIAAMQEALI